MEWMICGAHLASNTFSSHINLEGTWFLWLYGQNMNVLRQSTYICGKVWVLQMLREWRPVVAAEAYNLTSSRVVHLSIQFTYEMHAKAGP